MMSAFPSHLQQSQMYHRMQQHHQQQQAMNAAMRHQQQQQAVIAAMQQQQQQQQSSQRGSPGAPSLGSGDHAKMQQWQEQNQLHKNILSAKVPAISSPKSQLPKHPEMGGESKMQNSKTAIGLAGLSEMTKRSHPDWSNCVEGTKPQLVKRRKLYSVNCGHVEPWRLMMSLKSGLLADSTWALDTLTILLHDESTFGYFNLKHHHSLLDTIVSHFKVMLSCVFDLEFRDTHKYCSPEGEDCSAPERKRLKQEDGLSEDGGKSGANGGDSDSLTKALLMRACETDYDILSEEAHDKAPSEEKPPDGLSVPPVASVYKTKDLKSGRSDNLSHISVPSLEDPFFPQEAVLLDIVPEEERLRMERESLLQRIDQTPVSVLLKREALLTKIPLHRFSRLSHSPRRRDRNFFGDLRRRESLNVDEDKTGSGNAATLVAATMECSKVDVFPTSAGDEDATTIKKENKCKSPLACESLSASRRSASSSPLKQEALSPIMREESDVYRKEELPLWTVSPSKENLESRCKCISNILRSLTFVPGNDVEFCQHPGILIILGKLLMLHHYHLLHSAEKRKVSATRTGDDLVGTLESDCGFDVRKVDDQQFPPAEDYWWWTCLDVLREDTLVILANISGQLDLSIFPEEIAFPIIDGLLHWLVCPSSVACDPLPDSSKAYSQSPQRLVVETLAKMTISEVNVDLILATPPLMRLDLLFSQLGQMVGQKKYPVVRQFALVLLSNLAQGNESSSRLIGQQKMVMSLLLECLEIAEHMACMGQGTMEGGYGKEDPSSLSVAMLRRAASTLYFLSRVPAIRTAFLPYRDRILYLSTSQYVAPSVSSILMDMLYEFGKL